MDELEFQERDKKTRKMVEEAHANLRENPLRVRFSDELMPKILLGLKLQVTNINFMTNTVTFRLVE